MKWHYKIVSNTDPEDIQDDSSLHDCSYGKGDVRPFEGYESIEEAKTMGDKQSAEWELTDTHKVVVYNNRNHPTQSYNMKEEFYYCQSQIEDRDVCDTQCDHCKAYYKPLEDDRNKEAILKALCYGTDFENSTIPNIVAYQAMEQYSQQQNEKLREALKEIIELSNCAADCSDTALLNIEQTACEALKEGE